MRFVALVSGGKDSVFSLGKAMAHGHELICLANLYPPGTVCMDAREYGCCVA